MEYFWRVVPQWIIAAALVAFVAVFVERTYISKESFRLFGQEFGPVRDDSQEELRKLRSEIAQLKAQIQELEARRPQGDTTTLAGVSFTIWYDNERAKDAISAKKKVESHGANVRLIETDCRHLSGRRIGKNTVYYRHGSVLEAAIVTTRLLKSLGVKELDKVKHDPPDDKDILICLG